MLNTMVGESGSETAARQKHAADPSTCIRNLIERYEPVLQEISYEMSSTVRISAQWPESSAKASTGQCFCLGIQMDTSAAVLRSSP
jgi:hypothetical protein